MTLYPTTNDRDYYDRKALALTAEIKRLQSELAEVLREKWIASAEQWAAGQHV